MTDDPSPPTSPTPSSQPPIAPRPVHAQPTIAPQPQVVQIVAKPGGFWRAVTLVIGVLLFAGVFLIGVTFGIVGMVAGGSFQGLVLEETYRDGGRDAVAIIPIRGIIDQSQAEFVHASVDHVLSNSKIKSVVLRVNSPGGEVTASDEIWHDVNRLKKSGLPVVASYGAFAASGGYYVSCAADHIIAQATCVTGSIGVIAQLLTFEELLTKIGVEPVTMIATRSPEKSTANDIFRTWNDHDRETVTRMLDNSYAMFHKRVTDGRNHVMSSPEAIDSIANGSIYSAREAVANGLIDGIGYLDDAIAHSEKLAGIPTGSSKVVKIRKPPSFFDGDFVFQRNAKHKVWDADEIRSLVNELASPKAMYLVR